MATKTIPANMYGWIGSHVRVGKGKILKSIDVRLYKSGGRSVGLMFWPRNDSNYSSYAFTSGIRANKCEIIEGSEDKTNPAIFKSGAYAYIDTSRITSSSVLCRFYFDYVMKIVNYEDVLVAIYNASESQGVNNKYVNYDKKPLTFETTSNIKSPLINIKSLYYIDQRLQYLDLADVKTSVKTINNYSILFENLKGEYLNQNENDSSNSVYIDKIQCSELKYRTLSEPNNSSELNHNGWHDGGETLFSCYKDKNSNDGISLESEGSKNPSQVKLANKLISYPNLDVLRDLFDYNNPSNYDKHKINYIVNLRGKNNNDTTSFIEDYDIPCGRLNDVIFLNPQDGLSEDSPRYVFKRSRIKFTFKVPEKTKNGYRNFVLRYKVNTGVRYISEKTTVNKTQNRGWIACKYEIDKYKNEDNFSLIICPRDEGVLDNSYFNITFEWAYHISGIDGADWTKGSQITYYFKTYQKPQINITYPKIIRNSATTDKSGLINHRRFKLLTYNNFSNFVDENGLCNKYVCDALNVMYTTQPSDGSIFPTFVRFYLAEFRYGRTDCNKSTPTTIQQSVQSDKSTDYANKDQIYEKSTSNMKTAYISATQICDGSPILFSGRVENKDLLDYVAENKIWTFNRWDNVNIDNSPITYNSFKINDVNNNMTNMTPEKTNDHYHYLSFAPENDNQETRPKATLSSGASVYCVTNKDSGGNNYNLLNQEVTDLILFRAGYIYMLKLRAFHGAACGMIYKMKYGNNEASQYGISYIYDNMYSSGFYDYTNLTSYGYNQTSTSVNIAPDLDDLDDNKYDKINYLSKTLSWNGAPDGTSGYDPEHECINRTYPGFSEIDYTLIQPLCPFSSSSNIILKHPSSHETGVNQWLTFSYRHLSKNLSGLDDWRTSGEGNSHGFGTNATGIQNTMTRIASMHKSCVDTIKSAILNDVAGETGPFTNKNNKRNYNGVWSSTSINNNNDEFFETLKNQQSNKLVHENINKYEYENELMDCECKIFLYPGKLYNHLPYNNSYLAYKYAEACYDINNSFNNALYTYNYISEEGTYSKFITGSENKDECTAENPYNLDMDYPYTPTGKIYYPEAYINNYNSLHYNNYKENESIKNNLYDDCSGNVYRWQVVINAVDDDGKKIQINNTDSDGKYKLYVDSNNLKSNNTGNENSYWCNLIHKNNGDGSITNKLSYDDNIQTKYYYEDDYNAEFEKYTNKYETNESGTITKHRFTIAEFAGNTNASFVDGIFINYTKNSPVWPANYIAKSSDQFFYNTNGYGSLFKRVPSSQDCECGEPTTNYGLLFKESGKESKDMEEGSRNIYPLTRISHYLYFKTRIRTSYVTLIRLRYKSTQNKYECQGYTTTEFGTTHNGDIETSDENYHSILAFIGYKDNHPDFKVIKHEISNSEIELINYSEATPFLFSDPSTYNCDLEDNYLINFGNKGFSEVYGEDNYNWGRCLSAEDSASIALTSDGTSSGTSVGTLDYQGGIETPILCRYTPLLQPKLDSIKINNKNIEDRIINAVVYTNTNRIEFLAHTSDDVKKLKSNELILNIHYPIIAENGTYNTRLANGGMAIENEHGDIINAGFNNYNIDIDSSEYPLGLPNQKQNTDFLGGYGICTAYTILLVPSNPNKNKLKGNEPNYQQNTNGHWNYFKQPANYYSKYKSTDNETCIYDVESQAQNNTYYKGKTILVAHKVKPELKTNEYLETPAKGKRATAKIPLNIRNIMRRKPITNNNEELSDILNLINKDKGNTLVSGTTYDLVIIPIYTTDTCDDYMFTDGAGTINGNRYAGGSEDNVPGYYGSNPLVLYNFLTVTTGIESIDNGEYIPDPPDPDDPPQPNDEYVLDTDPAIIFPNINNKKYNLMDGEYKELPGFWLNNSFKLILRLPSYRKEPLFPGDMLTIEQQSNNELTKDNSINDFEFSDIQIHIGKYKNIKDNIESINKFGDNQIELAKYNIISYRHFWDKNVFSKKLTNNEAINDNRDKATAGGLNNEDKNYKNRFIEVNLSNAYFLDEDGNENGIISKEKEGMYIQFRVKTAYGNGVESQGWTPWYGGTKDGNYTWWGTKGTDYYVPLRNYSEIFTEYRSLIKESYPGSYSKLSKDLVNGQGSLNTQPYIDDDSKTNPQSSKPSDYHYYYIGNGNHKESNIIPTINIDHNNENDYKFGYQQTHDKDIDLSVDSINMHNQMYEMLYLYYIINNLSKLYYKPDNYETTDKFFKYHLQVPKINNKNYILEFNNGVKPEKFYMNRYYRRIIDKSDFDYLNKRIKDLSEYIRNEVYHGTYQTDYNSGDYDTIINSSTISPSKEQLNFNKIARQVIGHDLFGNYGQGNYNNLNFTKVTTNYLLEIWNKIGELIAPYRLFFDELRIKKLDDDN